MLFGVGVTGGLGFFGDALIMLVAIFGLLFLILYFLLASLTHSIREVGLHPLLACIPIFSIYLITKKAAGSFLMWLFTHGLLVFFAIFSARIMTHFSTSSTIGQLIISIVLCIALIVILRIAMYSIGLDAPFFSLLLFDLFHWYAFAYIIDAIIAGCKIFLAA